MPVVAVFRYPTDPVARYEAAFADGGDVMVDQPRRLHHVCHRLGDVGFVVVDVWEDEAAFDAFRAALGIDDAVIARDGTPTVHALLGALPSLGGGSPVAGRVG